MKKVYVSLVLVLLVLVLSGLFLGCSNADNGFIPIVHSYEQDFNVEVYRLVSGDQKPVEGEIVYMVPYDTNLVSPRIEVAEYKSLDRGEISVVAWHSPEEFGLHYYVKRDTLFLVDPYHIVNDQFRVRLISGN